MSLDLSLDLSLAFYPALLLASRLPSCICILHVLSSFLVSFLSSFLLLLALPFLLPCVLPCVTPCLLPCLLPCVSGHFLCRVSCLCLLPCFLSFLLFAVWYLVSSLSSHLVSSFPVPSLVSSLVLSPFCVFWPCLLVVSLWWRLLVGPFNCGCHCFLLSFLRYEQIGSKLKVWPSLSSTSCFETIFCGSLN